MVTYENVHVLSEPQLELYAVIVIDNTKHGPALGGCRFLNYASPEAMTQDAIRLARSMTYKTAINALAYGGGKAVLHKPKQIKNRVAFLKTFAEFVNSLHGDYITTIDSGLSIEDLNIISDYTKYVTGNSTDIHIENDPSPYTAKSVIIGMQAALKFKFNNASIAGVRIAIQGIGQVSSFLIQELKNRGANIVACDINPAAAEAASKKFDIELVAADQIYSVPCDIFAPCALGGSINAQTIPLLKTSIIAGCANNQLLDDTSGELLMQSDILYVPDYVINAGGLIKVASQYNNESLSSVEVRIDKIYDKLFEIFESAVKCKKSTVKIADEIVLKRLRS